MWNFECDNALENTGSVEPAQEVLTIPRNTESDQLIFGLILAIAVS